MLKQNIDELQIGDWCFQDSIKDGVRYSNFYIAVRFLDGDRGFAILPISPSDGIKNVYGQNCWAWNGNKESPTLSPSILHWGDGKDKPASWHGFLRDGKLETA